MLRIKQVAHIVNVEEAFNNEPHGIKDYCGMDMVYQVFITINLGKRPENQVHQNEINQQKK